ncbi:hypothetical protein [Thiomicrorhabdus aquaedulcis]|uniref:hypothetical protein n=1 Tax=Thiomicrorhabdus aquaedulcis TaxID=2211106 RepID=UPI001E5EACF6|nr:hypothetical protein [Thiomicrorhabdus aquaedulcis]
MHKLPWLQSFKLSSIAFTHAYRTNILATIMGIIFGFLMSRAGATTYDYHAEMFLFIDMQLMKVIGTAVVVAIIGVTLLKNFTLMPSALGVKWILSKSPIKKV